ncbi:hypothetical protein [Fodinicurvata sp. EGI_FJ10296]|uniref:hypothetical protein n=1 Tax=Fodinicurvata sp. EGI_FJ10296 TaxID=3231908 RepID=UPI003453A94A
MRIDSQSGADGREAGMGYTHRGWFIPGKLTPGWDRCFRQNLNDMRVKFQQLGIRPILPGLAGETDLGLYFSQAQYSFTQFLSTPPPKEWTGAAGDHSLGSTQTIVAYSLWMAGQEWSSFSPIPVLTVDDAPQTIASFVHPPADPQFRHSPFGWLLIGELTQTWYADLGRNLERAAAKRQELQLVDTTPFYVTQSSEIDSVQVVQTTRFDDAGLQDRAMVMAYAEWFGANGFGRLGVTPMLGATLVEAAVFAAQRNP